MAARSEVDVELVVMSIIRYPVERHTSSEVVGVKSKTSLSIELNSSHEVQRSSEFPGVGKEKQKFRVRPSRTDESDE